MAWNKIGSGQLKDGVILTQHIGAKAVEGTHIADKAITDVHLNIDWAAKASLILGSKLVVDYVQAPARKVAANTTKINIASDITLAEAATDNDLGVVVSATKNKVILLEKNDPSKLLTDPATGEVVFGRITTGFDVTFFKLEEGIEKAYTFDTETEFNLQFPARFTLEAVSEMFAANEKFVDGVADVATRLDVAQLVADIFGAGYTLNKDGQPTLASGQTIVDVIDAVEEVALQNSGDIDALTLVLSGTTDNPASGIVSKVSVLESKVSTLEGQNLNTRLTAIEDEDFGTRVPELEKDVEALKKVEIPVARRANKKADVEVSSYNLVTDFGVTVTHLPLEGTVDVYVNGMLQMAGQHYAETIVDGAVTGINFTPNVVKVDDIVQLRWTR